MFTGDPTKIRPKRDWAIICHGGRKHVLPSGIILPSETHDEKLHEGSGTVVRLGDGPKVRAAGLQIGDRVMYRTYLRHALRIEKWALSDDPKQEYFFIDVSDLIAVISTDLDVGPLSRGKTQ